MAQQIILVRHGESIGNAGMRTPSAQSIPLSEKGFLEAEALINLLPEADAVIYSPYIRTQQTAAPFLKKHPHIVPEEWYDTHETKFLGEGKYDNTTQAERAAFVKAYWDRNDPLHREADTAETFKEFLQRGSRTIEKLRDHPGGVVVLFSHNGFIQLLQFLHEHAAFIQEQEADGLKVVMRMYRERLHDNLVPNATPIDFSYILES